jgi:hypothetical protein
VNAFDRSIQARLVVAEAVEVTCPKHVADTKQKLIAAKCSLKPDSRMVDVRKFYSRWNDRIARKFRKI